jgi:hypothetical protein
MTTSAIGANIVLNFGWVGPSSWHGERSHDRLVVGVAELKNLPEECKIQ